MYITKENNGIIEGNNAKPNLIIFHNGLNELLLLLIFVPIGKLTIYIFTKDLGFII